MTERTSPPWAVIIALAIGVVIGSILGAGVGITAIALNHMERFAVLESKVDSGMTDLKGFVDFQNQNQIEMRATFDQFFGPPRKKK